MQRRLIIIGIVFVVGFGLGYGATWLLVGSPGMVKAPPADVAASAEPPAGEAAAPAGLAPEAAPPTQPELDAEADSPGERAPATDEASPSDASAIPADKAEEPEPELDAPSHPCVGQTCRLDFGGVSGGISVRRGKLEDGQAVTWDDDFGSADRLGLIPEGPRVRVDVKAVGHTDGEPGAAWVTFRHRGTSLTGVIALKVGDKTLRLVP